MLGDLRSRHRVSRIRMRRRSIRRIPRSSLPIHQARGAAARRCLPTTARRSGVIATFVKIVFCRSASITLRIRLHARSRRHAEKSRLRIDRVQISVGANLHPRDVVAHRPNAIALAFERGNHHRQIRLAASARKRRAPCTSLFRWDLPGPESACARPSSPARAPSSLRCAAQNISCPAARCRRSPSRRSRSIFLRGSAR